MMGSKQTAVPPAAANRPPTYTSHARGRGNNLSKQIDESRGEGVGREGKESYLIASYSHCLMRWMTSTIHHHQTVSRSRQFLPQAGEFDEKKSPSPLIPPEKGRRGRARARERQTK